MWFGVLTSSSDSDPEFGRLYQEFLDQQTRETSLQAVFPLPKASPLVDSQGYTVHTPSLPASGSDILPPVQAVSPLPKAPPFRPAFGASTPVKAPPRTPPFTAGLVRSRSPPLRQSIYARGGDVTYRQARELIDAGLLPRWLEHNLENWRQFRFRTARLRGLPAAVEGEVVPPHILELSEDNQRFSNRLLAADFRFAREPRVDTEDLVDGSVSLAYSRDSLWSGSPPFNLIPGPASLPEDPQDPQILFDTLRLARVVHRWYRFASGAVVLSGLEIHRVLFERRRVSFAPISVWAGLGWYKLDSLHPEGLCCRSGFPELVGYRILYSYSSGDSWEVEPEPSRLRGWVPYFEEYSSELPSRNPAYFRRYLRG